MNYRFLLTIAFVVTCLGALTANDLQSQDATEEMQEFRQNIIEVNNQFYNQSGTSFDKIPFDPLLPELLGRYSLGTHVLEIGSGGGALALWLSEQGCHVSCIEPAEALAMQAKAKNLKVYPTTIQEFQTLDRYDSILAISSLIHVPKGDLPAEKRKIAALLNPKGLLIVSFIEGEEEGYSDPTSCGKWRYFAHWSPSELEVLFSSEFTLLEEHRIYNPKMDRTFLLRAYRRN